MKARLELAQGSPCGDRSAWPTWLVPGWYPVAIASELRHGETTPTALAGRDLVLYRTASGRPVALDRYCAHLGASLAGGRVVGDEIECPFHGWRYDSVGRCTGLPRSDKVPPRARVGGHEIVERFGLLWVLASRHRYDPPSELGFLPPPLWRFVGASDLGVVGTGIRDIIENGLDVEHSYPVHGVSEIEFDTATFDLERRIAHVEFTVGFKKMGRMARNKGIVDIFGPSLWATTMPSALDLGDGAGALAKSLDFGFCILVAPQPIAPRKTRVLILCYVKSPHRLRGMLAGNIVFSNWKKGAVNDLRIWDEKTTPEDPVFGPRDGNIVRFRKYWDDLAADRRAGDVSRPATAGS